MSRRNLARELDRTGRIDAGQVGAIARFPLVLIDVAADAGVEGTTSVALGGLDMALWDAWAHAPSAPPAGRRGPRVDRKA